MGITYNGHLISLQVALRENQEAIRQEFRAARKFKRKANTKHLSAAVRRIREQITKLTTPALEL